MYWGHCANCGADPQSHRMKVARRSHPRGRNIPQHITYQLPHQTSQNNRVCEMCYVQLRGEQREQQVTAPPEPSSAPLSALDALASAAAGVQQSTSLIPATEAPLQALHVILPQPPPLQFLSSSINNIYHHALPLEPITSTVSAPSILPSGRRVLGDITNQVSNSSMISSQTTPIMINRKRKRHSISIKQKENLVKQWNNETDRCMRKQLLQETGRTTSDIAKYKKLIQQRNDTPKRQRTATKYKRTKGAGPPTLLTYTQEKEIYDWIMKQRAEALRVTEKDIKRHARAQYDIKATASWLSGFMDRQGLSTRLRTTHKYVVDNEKCQHTAAQYRLDRKEKTFPFYHVACCWNMDETGVYLDSVGNRTVDKKGAKVVCIKGTKGDKDRVTCIICVSTTGAVMDLLMIHKATGKEKRNTIYIKKVSFLDSNNVRQWKRIYVTYTAKTMITERIMVAWLRHLFYPHACREASMHNTECKLLLFCDNASSHRTEGVDKVFDELKIKHEYFPANCTPLVQPLDFNLNALFKRAYEDEWSKWYKTIGRFRKNKKGNQGKPTQDEVNSWCAAAIHTISSHITLKSWNHCLKGAAVLEESEKLCNEKGNIIVPEQPISTANNRWTKQPLNSLRISGELILRDETVTVISTPAIIISSTDNSHRATAAQDSEDDDEIEESDEEESEDDETDTENEDDDRDEEKEEDVEDDDDEDDNNNEVAVVVEEEEDDDNEDDEDDDNEDDEDDDMFEHKYDDQ